MIKFIKTFFSRLLKKLFSKRHHYKVTVEIVKEFIEVHPDTNALEPIERLVYQTYSTWANSTKEARTEAEDKGYKVVDCMDANKWEEHQAWLAANPVPF